MKSFPSFFQKKQWFSTSSFIICSFILIFPFLLVTFHFILKKQEIGNLKERIDSLKVLVKKKESFIKKEESILKQIHNSKSGYIQDSLESMNFLALERQKWQIFSETIEPSLPIKERVSFLEQGKNKLKFTTTEVSKNKLFQETEEKQQTPVEMSEEDLKILLCYVEGTRIHPHIPKQESPQLLLKYFELQKKSFMGIKDKTYSIQMELIKREGL